MLGMCQVTCPPPEARNLAFFGTTVLKAGQTKSRIPPDISKREHDLATFFNTKTVRGNPAISRFFDDNAGINTFEIYQLGSEVMQYNDGFQKYRGKIDLVFTSPP